MPAQPARSPDRPTQDRAQVARPGRHDSLHPVLARAICVLRVLLLIPLALCVVGAWLAATVLATVWALLVPPFRRRDHGTLD